MTMRSKFLVAVFLTISLGAPAYAQSTASGITPCGGGKSLSVSGVTSNVQLSACGTTAIIWNVGSQEVFLNVGIASNTAATTAAGYSLPAGAVMTISTGAAPLYVAGITSTSTSTLRITQGMGSTAVGAGLAAGSGGGTITVTGSVTTLPTAGPVTNSSITVTNSSGAFLAASTATKFLSCKNESATASIALNFAGGTAALNTAGNITLTPGAAITFDGTQVPTGAITAISSVASSPATCISS